MSGPLWPSLVFPGCLPAMPIGRVASHVTDFSLDLLLFFSSCSINAGTEIITETISRVDLSQRPFKYWREGEEDDEAAFETAST